LSIAIWTGGRWAVGPPVGTIAADMTYGVSLEHTTLPKDPGLRLDPDAREHLVAAVPAGPAVRRLRAEHARDGHGPLTLLEGDEDAVLAALAERLAAAGVGLRLYVAGAEGFVRRAVRVGLDAGLVADEILTEVDAGAARDVWCSHCKAITRGVTTTVAPCAGCGRMLEVFHHFSRRHAAYMGFQVDAEVPGEIPEPEVRWA